MYERCEFFIVRYFADPIRDEPINIGIILVGVGETSERAPLVRITQSWRRVLCIDPDADTAMLGQLEASLQARLSDPGPAGRAALEKLDHALSTTLRLERANFFVGSAASVKLAGGKAALTDNFAAEIDRLMRLYVEERVYPDDDEEDLGHTN